MINTQYLKSVPLFAKLSDEEREKIASIIITRKYSKDIPIFWQNDPADHLFIVHNGKVKISRVDYDFDHRSKTLDEYTLEVLKSGDFFGEDSLIDGKEYTCSATSLTYTVVFAINKDDFKQLAQENPELAHKISRSLALLLLFKEEGFQVSDLGMQIKWVS